MGGWRTTRDAADESVGTVLLAGSANLAIAIAKLVGGLISGSTAMLAEAAHSVADTLNQVFLMAALKRSQKPADAQHPFGYGMERYFWSLLAAVGHLRAGRRLLDLRGHQGGAPPRAARRPAGLLRRARRSASSSRAPPGSRRSGSCAARPAERGIGFFEHLRITPDPTAKTVAFEDTAALIGLVLAAVGITLHHLTGQGFWDGGASIAIGLLLVLVAYALGQQNKRALIGEALPEEHPGRDPPGHRRVARASTAWWSC